MVSAIISPTCLYMDAIKTFSWAQTVVEICHIDTNNKFLLCLCLLNIPVIPLKREENFYSSHLPVYKALDMPSYCRDISLFLHTQMML